MGQLLEKIRSIAPEGTARVEVGYYGSGDSFDSFQETTVLDEKGEHMPEGLKEEIDKDDLWKVLEVADISFDNDGAQGKIVFDLINNRAYVENNWIVQTTEYDGEYEYQDPEESSDKEGS